MLGTGLGIYIPYALYAAILIACLVGISMRPLFAYCVAALILPLQTLRERLSDLPLGENAIVILLLSALIGSCVREHHTGIPANRVNRYLLAFFGFLYFSLWWGTFTLNDFPLWINNPRANGFKDLLVLPLLYLGGLLVLQKERDIKLLLVTLFVSFLLVERGFALETFTHSWTAFDENKRSAGPLGFAGANGFAAFQAYVSSIIIAGLSFRMQKRLRVLLLIVLPICLVCLLYTFSRGAYVSLFLTMLLLGMVRMRKLLPLLLAVSLLWTVVLPTPVQQRITMTYNDRTGKMEESAESRVDLWTDAMELVGENPVLGTGLLTYQFLGRHATLRDTHNYYVKVVVECGFVGLLLFVLLLGIMLLEGWRLFRAAGSDLQRFLGLAVLLAVFSLAISNFFGDRWTFVEVAGFLWVLLAAAVRQASTVSVNEEYTEILHVTRKQFAQK